MHVYANTFRQFAEKEAKGSSELYYFLSNRIIEDEDLMEIIKMIPLNQPKPNLFFAAMHYLVSKSDSPLRQYYPSLTDSPLQVEKSFEPFKEFALNHKSRLIELFSSKLVQTNEVRRASYLYPLFLGINRKKNKPLTLIEIGTSAGLLLGLDSYNYQYKEENLSLRVESVKDSILIQAENKGEKLPSYIQSNLEIHNRIGIDLNIVDLNNEEDFEWMLALIWPEHLERRKQFSEASNIIRKINKTMYEGNLLELLSNIIRSSSSESQIVIFHTHVANQFPPQLKKKFKELLTQLSYNRSIYHVYNNMHDTNIHQDLIENGNVINEKILQAPDGHGRWFYWG